MARSHQVGLLSTQKQPLAQAQQRARALLVADGGVTLLPTPRQTRARLNAGLRSRPSRVAGLANTTSGLIGRSGYEQSCRKAHAARAGDPHVAEAIVRCDPAARMTAIISPGDRRHRNAATQIAPLRTAGSRLKRLRLGDFSFQAKAEAPPCDRRGRRPLSSRMKRAAGLSRPRGPSRAHPLTERTLWPPSSMPIMR